MVLFRTISNLKKLNFCNFFRSFPQSFPRTSSCYFLPLRALFCSHFSTPYVSPIFPLSEGSFEVKVPKILPRSAPVPPQLFCPFRGLLRPTKFPLILPHEPPAFSLSGDRFEKLPSFFRQWTKIADKVFIIKKTFTRFDSV